MFTREELLSSPEYWFEGEQDELFRQVSSYMEREKINRTELAKRLNVSKGYVSQILSGESNFTLKKIIEICVSIGLVPQIKYRYINDVINQEKKNNIQPEVGNVVHFRPYKMPSDARDYIERDSIMLSYNTRITLENPIIPQVS